MANLDLNLKSRCHVNRNGDGDRFVGIKADSGGVAVCFPMGYRLPDDEEEIRADIMLLISALSEFGEPKDGRLETGRFDDFRSADFPITAYLTIIRRYLAENAYYTERETVRRVSDRGKIDWPASLRRNAAFIEEDGTAYFRNYTVRSAKPDETNLVTRIHKYCVYESFRRLGWLFTDYVPADPRIERQSELFLYALRKKLNAVRLERDRELLQAMTAVIENLDGAESDERFYFGTERFEYVWESLIDKVFGVPNKKDYFPRTHWTLKYAEKRRNHALEPDSVMLYGGKIYVLDAKYYRYGVTNNPAHLPESSSVNKQITYAEYIASAEKIKAEYGEEVPVFNAFLMPFNREDNAFHADDAFVVIGEATADWKHGTHDYERVFGVVIDTRFLMRRYYGAHAGDVKKLAATIDKAVAESRRHNSGRCP